MFDCVCIIKSSGHLLWSMGKINAQIINECIMNEIIPKGLSFGTCHIKSFTIDFLQRSNMTFLSIHPTAIHIPYTQDLLEQLSLRFTKEYPTEKSNDGYSGFSNVFVELVTGFQNTYLKKESGLDHQTISKQHNPKPTKKKSEKENRVWGDAKLSNEDMDLLDYSGTSTATNNSKENCNQNVNSNQQKKLDGLIDQQSLGKRTKDGFYEAKEMTAVKKEGCSLASEKDFSSTGVFSFFQGLKLERTLDSALLDPIMLKMKEHLIQKNVASDISKSICEAVAHSLLSTKLSSFSSLSSHVRTHIEKHLTRILTPKCATDILREIKKVNLEKKRPYTLVFIGVNGVGKSTNLSKVCFWLLQNKFKILIAACDTFRSGAVEQLKVHVRNLKSLLQEEVWVDLYEKGYGKDAAGIAKEAVQYATEHGYDVVLVDTAGRMQNNEPLMRSLAKLVTVNQPDKIIFVGEALVGNEAVDQLTKFNLALKDYSGVQQPRRIDGIILTKFDTVDDKVGAALTMTYITGMPILFVGTGQTYTDIRKLDILTIVDALLS